MPTDCITRALCSTQRESRRAQQMQCKERFKSWLVLHGGVAFGHRRLNPNPIRTNEPKGAFPRLSERPFVLLEAPAAPFSQMMGLWRGVRMSPGTRVSPAVRGTSKGQPNGPARTRQVVGGLARRGTPRPSRALAIEALGREVEVGRGYPLDAEGLEEVLRVLSEGQKRRGRRGRARRACPWAPSRPRSSGAMRHAS